MDESDVVVSFKPSAFYFREALRECESLDESLEVGLALCRELEELKRFIRELGEIPPKRFIMQSECDAKGWGGSEGA